MALIRRNNRGAREVSSFDDYFRWPSLWEDVPLVTWGDLRGVAADVYETDHDVVVALALPSINPDDVTISVSGTTLTISGENKQEEEQDDTQKNYHVRQLRYGQFAQSITLPSEVQVDKSDAFYKNGMLKITLPKAEHNRSTQIKIRSEGKESK